MVKTCPSKGVSQEVQIMHRQATQLHWVENQHCHFIKYALTALKKLFLENWFETTFVQRKST
ncbi:MAG: hypothetical protein F6J89_26765 [Symploca sp. SIO1C4]|uniref:Uncharacterized protein n=1 Tax=Symploca sp. SIO1C4 TaxID=2607765 RepID=A0A6B3NLQ3_9CYAN|nr:hypothetical protein [Symploca sp. SIO1C4]